MFNLIDVLLTQQDDKIVLFVSCRFLFVGESKKLFKGERKMKKSISIFFAITVSFLFFSGFVCAQTKSIKVGAAINLTGPASTWGQFHEKGQRDYFRYVNEVKGGVFGNKIDIITQN